MSTTISESTKVKVSLIIGISAGVIAIIWWAATMHVQMTNVVITLKSLETLTTAAIADNTRLDKQVAVANSEMLGKHTALERRVQQLENHLSRRSSTTQVVP